MGERTAAGIDQQGVDMPVIAAFELDYFIPLREPARQANARHRRFGAAVYHPHLFNRGNPSTDQFGHFHFERIGNSETDSALSRVANSVDHHLWRMAQNRRAPSANIIDVFLSLD